MFQSANERILDSESKIGDGIDPFIMSFQSAKERVFDSESAAVSPLATEVKTPLWANLLKSAKNRSACTIEK